MWQVLSRWLRCCGLLAVFAGTLACERVDEASPGLARPKWVTSLFALNICPSGETTQGIDVSYWQGAIDWDKVAADGVKFVFIRVAQGLTVDERFDANWAGAREVGLIRGAYHSLEPSEDIQAQANAVVTKLGMLAPDDLPVVLDVEYTDQVPTVQDLQDWVDIVSQGTGKLPIIYTSKAFWNQYFSAEFQYLPLWVANWDAECPTVPDGWSEWWFWQTTGGGLHVDGIIGEVDFDLFNGSVDDLMNFASGDLVNGCPGQVMVACGKTGCSCADGACSGESCSGSGCSEQEAAECAALECSCVDHVCSGGQCGGTGCTLKETTDCQAQGCLCVDHTCSGGTCSGSGCTARQMAECGELFCKDAECVECTPDCTTPGGDPAVCGDDGCGGVCGTCDADNVCDSGVCVSEPQDVTSQDSTEDSTQEDVDTFADVSSPDTGAVLDLTTGKPDVWSPDADVDVTIPDGGSRSRGGCETGQATGCGPLLLLLLCFGVLVARCRQATQASRP